MNSILKQNQRLVIKILVLITIIVPLSIVTYQVIFLGKKSVTFLEGYPAALGFAVIIYYCLLLTMGAIWLIVQLKSIVRLKNEKKRNELLHLQSQVNPHFFFNMLNNLYGLVGKDSEKARDLVLKLSELMRYSIYKGEENQVLLIEEVGYLKNFIEMNKMRYHKEIDVQFEVNIKDENQQVAPLMFIALLENAFKHGVENLRKDAFIKIKLSSDKAGIDFEISNNFDPNELPQKKGIGLKNLRRRLELTYPQKHTFRHSRKDSVFKATLQIKN